MAYFTNSYYFFNSYVDKREINTYDLYMSSLLQYVDRQRKASSLFLAHHPYDILKSKQVNILVTYWMKRLFQHWICSRTHRHSLQIFQQFLHNNLIHNLQVTRKFYSKRNNPFSSRNSVFLFKRPMQKKKTKKKHLTSNRQIRLYSLFLIPECTILNGISRKNRFMSALNNTVYIYSW